MERLTMFSAIGGYQEYDPIDIVENDYSIANFKKLVEKLGEYEDLEEQGLLLRLMCKPGDTVYEVQELRKRIQPYTIISIHVSKCSVLFGWELKDGKGIYSNVNGFCDDAIGKTVFLTKEEAEAKLKELGGRL